MHASQVMSDKEFFYFMGSAATWCPFSTTTARSAVRLLPPAGFLARPLDELSSLYAQEENAYWK